MKAEPLRRQLSGLGIWLLVVNGIIGGGIFGLPSEAARIAGAFSPWLFAACALLMLPVMLCFAELASHFDGTGGPVRYTRTAFGPFAAFQVGWAFYVARLTAFAANAALLVSAIGYFLPAADIPGVRLVLLAAICAGLAAVTVAGNRDAMGSLGVLTVLKLLPLALLAALGLSQRPDALVASLSSTWPPAPELGSGLLIVFYAYVGFESGLVPAGEARDPRRDMPRALGRALVAVALLYFALQVVAVATVPDIATSKRPLVEAAGSLVGPLGSVAMMIGMAASVGGNLAGTLFSTPRITYALALDGALPSWFARVPGRFGTPAVSIVVFAAAAFLLAAAGSFTWLAGLSVVTRLLIYLACVAAVPKLRARQPDEPALLRLPGGPLVPALAAIICVALLTQVKPADYLAAAALLGAGSLLYVIAAREARR